MKHAYIRSLTFWRLLASYFSLIAAVFLVIFLYTWRNNIHENFRMTQEDNNEAVSAIASYMESNLSEILIFADRLNTTTWVHKLYVDMDSINVEFDFMRRSDIGRDFLFFTESNETFRKLFLIYPYRDICISQDVWANINTYLGILGFKQQESEMFLNLITNINSITQIENVNWEGFRDDIMVIVPTEGIQKPRAYLCTLISADRISKNVNQLMTPSLVYARIVNNETGNTVFETDSLKAQSKLTVITRDSTYLDWTYEFYIDEKIYSITNSSILKDMSVFACAFFLGGLGLAYFLAWITYRPVSTLMKKISERNKQNSSGLKKNDYMIIGESFDRLTFECDEMTRANCCRKLLYGYFDQNADNLDKLHIPFENENFFQTYIVLSESVKDESRLKDTAKKTHLESILNNMPELRYETIDIAKDEYVIIAAFRDLATAQKLNTSIQQLIVNNCKIVFSGSIRQGIAGIGVSYQYAHKKYLYLYKNNLKKYYYPLEWEYQLIFGLRAGNANTLRNILKELKRENEHLLETGAISSEDYLRLLSSIMDSIYHAMEDITKKDHSVFDDLMTVFTQSSVPQIWEKFDTVCRTICSRIASQENIPRYGEELINYIDQNFQCKDITLSLMEDKFGLSSNTINKIFKTNTRETFYTYLTTKRMKSAKRLLESGEYPIYKVVDMTGYTNDSTFRRVFSRYFGVKPKEYVRNNNLKTLYR